MTSSKLKLKHQNLPCAVILTAIGDERRAVQAHFTDIEEETHPDGTVYKWGIFSENGQSWGVVSAQIGVGNDNAAVETKRAIDYFKPNVVLFVGVAGGLKDVKLGDVVAATKIYAYDSGKVEQEGFHPRPDAPRVSYRLEQRAMSEANEDEWLKRIKGRISRRQPQAFVGAIAAADKVLTSKNSDVYNLLLSNYGDALAVEMEGHGFLQAVRGNQEVNALVIRGISDLIDNKNKADKGGSQLTAAHHASAFAFQILAKLDVAQRQELLKEEVSRRTSEIEKIGKEIERDEGNIAFLEKQVQEAVPPQFRKALNWLAKRKEIARIAVELAMNDSSELRQFVESRDLPAFTRKQLNWQIEKYLERIYYSLYTDSRDLLQEPGIPLSLPVSAYQTVFTFVKQRVPEEDIGEAAAKLVRQHLEYLIARLS